MLKSVLFGVLMAGTIRVAAQDTLLAHGTAPDLYIVHTVKKGETWYSLGRAYGLSPKDIAARNKMQMDQGLSLGKQINVPLNKTNFAQDKGASGRPVYHHIGEKETLFRISQQYAKVPLDNIRQWNHFTGDGVKKDAYLVVGYVKGTSNSVKPAAATPPPPPPVVKNTPPPPPPVVKNTPPPVKETPVKETPVKETPVATTTPPPPPPVEEVKQTTPPPPPAEVVEEKKTTEPPVNSSMGRTPVVPDGGFEQMYDEQTNRGRDITKEKGPGTWFRSNAIVGSGKYYALHNTAPRGTILKVTNPLNGKSIYAKVLDAIPQLKANANLIIKLSDAAQEALGITDARFYCELSYEEK